MPEGRAPFISNKLHKDDRQFTAPSLLTLALETIYHTALGDPHQGDSLGKLVSSTGEGQAATVSRSPTLPRGDPIILELEYHQMGGSESMQGILPSDGLEGDTEAGGTLVEDRRSSESS